MDKKGFSTIELLVSFVIISFITIAMFRTVLILNDKLFYYEGTTKLIVFNGTFTNDMAKDLSTNQIDKITTCGINNDCYDISYQSLETKRLKVDTTNNTLQYGNIIQKLPKDASFNGNPLIQFNNNTSNGSIGVGKNNSILSVTIPIISDVIEGDYTINVVYQYDNRLVSFPMPLTSRFSAASASANGATGTYALKNGSNYFVGANPNNWIEFGQISATNSTPLLWRIIRSDANGIKIIYEGNEATIQQHPENMLIYGRISVLGSSAIPWDTTTSNKWERPASIKATINDWYNSLYVNNKNSYVQPINWCIGGVGNSINYPTNPVPLATFLNEECVDGTYTGGTFVGRTSDTSPVGLIKASDYLSTSSAATCVASYQTTGGTAADCGKLADDTITNFLYKSYWWWTSVAGGASTASIWTASSNGTLFTSSANGSGGPRPVINLKSDVIYTGGDGSLNNPYSINYPSSPLLSSKFTAASASANGADGTYALKNGSNYFIGANPNNWIEFGQVSASNNTPLLWRIIRSDNEGIKIIYEGTPNGTNPPIENGSIVIDGSSTTAWDTTNSNNWERPATIKAKLQTWFDNLYALNKNDYTAPINWCIGSVTWLDTINNIVNQECSTRTTSTTRIGFIKPSEYISTSAAVTCNSMNQSVCGTAGNFLYKSTYGYWTTNPLASYNNLVARIIQPGSIDNDNAVATRGVRPVLNLSPNVLYANGDGRLTNPYRLTLP